jgi:hypothetical protein
MFNSISAALNNKNKEHRRYPRKKMTFKFVWLRGGERVPGVGTELSEGGCLIATRDQPPKEFDAIFDLGKRQLPLRLRSVRGREFVREGTRWIAVGCSFSGIAADDYDALVRVLKNIPDSVNAARAELAAKDKTDDAYRLLPLAVQHRVLATLIKHGRIAMPPEGQAPLMRMDELGRGPDGHRLAVHSRIASHDGPQLFDSIIVIDPKGNVKIES